MIFNFYGFNHIPVHKLVTGELRTSSVKLSPNSAAVQHINSSPRLRAENSNRTDNL